MKIIIVGAGQVGGTLAENLVGEKNEITVIDANAETLRELQDRLDLKVVTGVGSYPDVLRQAGAEDADMLIAVTNSDESNMMACQVAHSLFNTPSKIARVRSEEYLLFQDDLFKPTDIPIDHVIDCMGCWYCGGVRCSWPVQRCGPVRSSNSPAMWSLCPFCP